MAHLAVEFKVSGWHDTKGFSEGWGSPSSCISCHGASHLLSLFIPAEGNATKIAA